MAEHLGPGASVGAKILGLLIFAVGIALLGFTFLWSYRLFHSPDLLVMANPTSGRAAPLGHSLGAAGLRVIILFVMAYVASLLSGRGVQLYAAGRGASKE